MSISRRRSRRSCEVTGERRRAVAAQFALASLRAETEERCSARFLLFRATGDRAHLAEARRLFHETLARAPEEPRESMCRNRREKREILAACERLGIA